MRLAIARRCSRPTAARCVFYSNREGNWGAWTIAIDGGGLRKITGPASGVMYPQVSSKDDRVIFVPITAEPGRFSVPFAATAAGASPTPLPGTAIGGKIVQSNRMVARRRAAGGLPPGGQRTGTGIGVYDIAAKP